MTDDRNWRPKRVTLFQFSIARMLVALTVAAVFLGFRAWLGVQMPAWWLVLAVLLLFILLLDYSYPLLGAAEKAFLRGDYARAVEMYSRAIKVQPHDPQRYYLRAAALGALGRFDEAILAACEAGRPYRDLGRAATHPPAG